MLSSDPRKITGETNALLDDIKEGQVQLNPVIAQVEHFMQDMPHLELYDYALPILQNTKAFSGWETYASDLLDEIERLLLEDIAQEWKGGDDARRAGDAKSTKASELFRKYGDVLRKIRNRCGVYAIVARDMRRDLYLEQTLPENELMTPRHLDSYTGELDVDLADVIPDGAHIVTGVKGLLQDIEDMDHVVRSSEGIVAGISPWNHYLHSRLPDIAKELGWDDATCQAFYKANAEFVGTEEDEEPPFDDRGYVPPTLTKDYEDENGVVIDYEGVARASDAIQAFRNRRGKIFKYMRLSHIQPWEWKSTFRAKMKQTEEFAGMVSAINETVQLYGPITGSAVYFKVSGDYGIRPKDVSDIGIPANLTISGHSTFGAFLAEYEDDMLELVNDPAPTVFPTSESRIDAFDRETIGCIEASLPKQDPNPLHTQAFVTANIQSTIAGATLGDAEKYGLAAWRKAMSPKAAAAYDEEFQHSHDHTKAMKAFWRECPSSVPRPQDSIVSIRGDGKGLVLKRGDRRIDWSIAAMKFKNNEFNIGEAAARQLLDYMSTHQCGGNFAALLAKKFS